jgi:hypothetical protein
LTANIAEQWLDEMARSTNEQDFDALLDLLSDHIRLLGKSDRDTVDQEEWLRRRKLEFESHTPKQVSYAPPQMTANLPGRLMFRTVETVQNNNGTFRHCPVEIIIQREEDGKWRALQQRPLAESSLERQSPRLAKA